MKDLRNYLRLLQEKQQRILQARRGPVLEHWATASDLNHSKPESDVAKENDTKKPKKKNAQFDLTPHQRKLVDIGSRIAADAPAEFLYQHRYLCGIYLPHRKTDEERIVLQNGNYAVAMESAVRYDPQFNPIRLGLPYGSRARLLMLHINDAAKKQKSPRIILEANTTRMLKQMGLSRNPRTRQELREQLGRLAGCDITFMKTDGNAHVDFVPGQFISKHDLWFQEDGEQKLIWPEYVELGDSYFEHLMAHAVPLDKRAIMAIQNNSQALDIYCWLAERLHRVNRNKPQLVYWTVLQNQFSTGYKRIRDFRRYFLKNLKEVQSVYPKARIRAETGGLVLFNSPPPVRKKYSVLVDNDRLDGSWALEKESESKDD